MRKTPHWLVNVLLLCGTILLFFGGIELLVRVTGLVKMHDYTPPIYERSDNPKISYTLKPNLRERAFRNLVTTDEYGFRISNLSSRVGRIEAPERRVRPYRGTVEETKSLDTSLLGSAEPRYGTTREDIIIVLGDSITFGYGVADDETLPANLQKHFPRYTVINAGTPGYHIGQEVALYKEKLAPLNPETLILIFYWNDFDQQTSWLDDGGVMRAEGWQPTEKTCSPIERGILGMIPGKCWLDLHSAFYKGVKKYVNTRTEIAERDTKRLEAQNNVHKSVQNSVQNDILLFGVALHELASIAPTNRLFVIWPDAELHEYARSELKTLAEREGFVVLDLYNHFGNTMETLSWDYVHPNAKSLRRVAGIIADHISITTTE